MFKPVPIKLKRGEAVFHHPLAVHGSLENKYYLIMIMIMMTGQWSVANGSLENKYYLMMIRIMIMIMMIDDWSMANALYVKRVNWV